MRIVHSLSLCTRVHTPACGGRRFGTGCALTYPDRKARRGGSAMRDTDAQAQPAQHDQLITQPDKPLPTTLDPASPEARGYPSDPKPGPGNPSTGPEARDIDRIA